MAIFNFKFGVCASPMCLDCSPRYDIYGHGNVYHTNYGPQALTSIWPWFQCISFAVSIGMGGSSISLSLASNLTTSLLLSEICG